MSTPSGTFLVLLCEFRTPVFLCRGSMGLDVIYLGLNGQGLSVYLKGISTWKCRDLDYFRGLFLSVIHSKVALFSIPLRLIEVAAELAVKISYSVR